MDENKTSSDILKEMLDEISDEYAKQKGSWLWQILKAIAIVICNNVWSVLAETKKMLLIDNMDEYYFPIYAKDNANMQKMDGSYANGNVTITGKGVVKAGELFATESGIYYALVKDIEIDGSGEGLVQCTVKGEIGNCRVGEICKIPRVINGIISVINDKSFENGTDEETLDDFKERYREYKGTSPGSANKAHYVIWAKEVVGVGGAKVVRTDTNKVDLYILNSEGKSAESGLVESVQKYIDPSGTGNGNGQAPIGASVTVKSAVAKEINISLKGKIVSGYDTESAVAEAKKIIDTYLSSVAYKNTVLEYSKIAELLYHCTGIASFQQLKINDNYNDVECLETEFFLLSKLEIV